MLRDNTIYLINCPPLDMSYNHTVNFSNKVNQRNWFIERCTYAITDCAYNKKDNSFIVDKYINDSAIRRANYCMLVNDEGLEEYYFIYNKEYKSDSSTRIYLKMDVLQTYYFDIDFGTTISYIDRCHLPRWNSDGTVAVQNMLEDEGLEVGEYMQGNVSTVYNYARKGSYIVTSSAPLSTATGGGDYEGDSDSDSGSSTDNWKKGLVSEDGYILIKSLETFASKSYNIGDGTNTIGYGTTEVYDGDNYYKLYPQCTEEQASIVFGESLDKNYAKHVLSTIKKCGRDLNTVKQCHFDSFCSFFYNTGTLSQHEFFTAFANGESDNRVAELMCETWISKGTKFEQGLRDRRKREANAFLGTYNPKRIYDYITGKYITENNGLGHIPDRYKNTVIETSSLRDNILKSAEKLLGKPYIYGGNYPPLGSNSGTDCSGLCQWAYNDNGIKISRTTYTQINEGKLVDLNSAKKGDLVFTRGYGDNGHVVMFIEKISDSKYKCIEAKGKDYGILYTERKVDSLHMFRNLIGD